MRFGGGFSSCQQLCLQRKRNGGDNKTNACRRIAWCSRLTGQIAHTSYEESLRAEKEIGRGHCVGQGEGGEGAWVGCRDRKGENRAENPQTSKVKSCSA